MTFETLAQAASSTTRERGKDRGQYADQLESERRRRCLREQFRGRQVRAGPSRRPSPATARRPPDPASCPCASRAITRQLARLLAPNRSCLITAPCIVTGTQRSGGVSLRPTNSSAITPTIVEQLIVEAYRRADHRRVAVEVSRPRLVTEDDDGAGAGRLRVECRERAAELDAPAERLEVVAGHEGGQVRMAVRRHRAVALGNHRVEQISRGAATPGNRSSGTSGRSASTAYRIRRPGGCASGPRTGCRDRARHTAAARRR